jgi:hypothetical protein
MAPLFGIYYCLTFWLLVVADAAVTNRGTRIPSRFAPEDRFIGYLFVAPLVWPVQLYRLLRRNSSTAA